MACGCKNKKENAPVTKVPTLPSPIPSPIHLTPELLKLKKEVSDSFDQNGGRENVMKMEPDKKKADMLVECYKNAFFYGLVYKKFEDDPNSTVPPFDLNIFKNTDLFPCHDMALNAFNDAIGDITL